jgi:hypothetical protein
MVIGLLFEGRPSAVTWVLILLLAHGCGRNNTPPLSAISGQVTFQERPVTQGEVHFMSEEGFGVSAPIDSQGTYSICRSQYGKGIPVGTYKVIVTPPPTDIDESIEPGKQAKQPLYPEIPPKYRDFSTSGLEFTVGKDAQKFDIHLER